MADTTSREPEHPSPGSAVDALETIEVKAGVFKHTCLALMDEVSEGSTQYVITKHGRAVAKLVPPDAEVGSAFGFLRGTILEQEDLVASDFDAWGEHSE